MMRYEARKLSSKQVVKITHSKAFETDSLIISLGGIGGSSFEEYILKQGGKINKEAIVRIGVHLNFGNENRGKEMFRRTE